MFAAVLGGFGMAGGPFAVLIQPNELVVIGGAALGTLIISAPGKIGKRVLHSLKKAFTGKAPGPQEYTDLLKLLYQLFHVMRREGILALEPHIAEPDKSSIFSRYPSVMKNHHAANFLIEGLKQIVDGCPIDDLRALFDADLDTMHDEEQQPVALLKTTGDALPGLGIVAAVLGIVITMGHLDGGPEVIGHHVGAALVGTFLGILLCYGLVAPIATSIELRCGAEARYVQCIRDGLLAGARGASPAIAIEFARRAIFSDERPSVQELEKAFAQLKSEGK